MADNFPTNAGAGGLTFASDDVGGVQIPRMKLVHGADGVNAGDVSATNGLPVQLLAAALATVLIGTVQAPTITKGTQGTEGFTVQDLKDAGRSIVNAMTAIAGVAGVGAEALVALDISRGGAATASATTHAVTAGKRWRVTGMKAGIINTGAAIINARVTLRLNPTGAAVVASPAIATLTLATAAATAGLGDSDFVPLDHEFSGANQIGVTQIGSAGTYTVWISLLGYEY